MAKILVLSDCHGNKHGLSVVLEAGKECDFTLCLGDIVGYGAHPNECCELLRERKAICLMGNHDAATVGALDPNWFNGRAQTAVYWTREHLSRGNFEWLQSLQPHQDLEEWGCEAVHASLVSPLEEYITDKYVASDSFIRMKRPLLFCGHTHQAMICTAHAEYSGWQNGLGMEWQRIPHGAEIELEPQEELTIINPGSCGQPRDGNPLAKALIYNSESFEVEFLAVEYDVKAARQAILDGGLPTMLGDRLLKGQ